MKLIGYLAACAGLVCVGGCQPWLPGFLQPKLSSVQPEQFTTVPEQRKLALAVDCGDEQAIAAAVKAGSNVNAVGVQGFHILTWAMARKNPKGFEALLKHGANLNADYRDPSYLPDASYRHSVLEMTLGCLDPRFIEAALRQGLDPNYMWAPEDKRTLLFLAVARHSIPVIKSLLAAGAEINGQDLSGYTPLVEAKTRLDYNEALVLLQHGADPTIRDEQGYDFAWWFKEFGSRGVRPDQRESFDKVVNELVRRGLLTHQDIVEADKPKKSVLDDGPPGETVIYHAPDSEAGQAILKLDQAEREANRRDGR